MPKCLVWGCDQNSFKGVTTHRFPYKNDLERARRWLILCKVEFGDIKNFNMFNFENLIICGKHFADDAYEEDLKTRLLNLQYPGKYNSKPRKKLKSDAVPSLFLPSTDTVCQPKGCRTSNPNPSVNRSCHMERKQVIMKSKTGHVLFPLACKYCPRSFANFQNLRSHFLHHEMRIKRYWYKKLKDELNQPPDQAVKKLHQCKYCSKYFSSVTDKRRHEVMHTGNKLHECQHCGKCFSSVTDKRRHELTHTGDKPHECRHCGKRFNSLSNTKRHEFAHLRHICQYCDKYASSTRCADDGGHGISPTEKKPHLCQYCSKGFRRPCQRRRHEDAHTRVKPYQCRYCSQSFFWASRWKRHEASHIGQKSFPCSYCTKWFTQDDYRKQHEAVHTGEHRCRFCNKSFRRSSNKNRHEMGHIGKKIFVCQYCEKGIGTLADLKRHEMLHTGDRPYQCRYCEKSFIRADVKERHEETHRTNGLYRTDGPTAS